MRQERAKIEAERDESQRMLAELQALKAQLAEKEIQQTEDGKRTSEDDGYNE